MAQPPAARELVVAQPPAPRNMVPAQQAAPHQTYVDPFDERDAEAGTAAAAQDDRSGTVDTADMELGEISESRLAKPLERLPPPVVPQEGARLIAGMRRKLRVPNAVAPVDAYAAAPAVDMPYAPAPNPMPPHPAHEADPRQNSVEPAAYAIEPIQVSEEVWPETPDAVQLAPAPYQPQDPPDYQAAYAERAQAEPFDRVEHGTTARRSSDTVLTPSGGSWLMGGSIATATLAMLATATVYLWPDLKPQPPVAPQPDRMFTADVICPGMKDSQPVKIKVPDETTVRTIISRDLPGCNVERITAGG